MALPKRRVRDLIDVSMEEVKKLPVWMIIQFEDDVETEVTRNETLYSWFFWALFKMYPNTKITSKHHVTNILKGQSLNTSTHTKLCTEILKSIVTDNQLWLPEQKEPVLDAIYRVAIYAMNVLSMEAEENVTSLDVLDFVNIALHPTILALKDEAKADPEKIKYVYEQSIKFIKHEPSFWSNGLAKALRSSMVKENQVLQCVVFRGYASEVDGAIFHHEPVWSNYTLGNRTLYDFAADSRTAAKSHYYADSSLQNSEYMARQFQLFTMVLERIVYKDCGSTDLIPWRVAPEVHDKTGTKIANGDLPNLVGKYYKRDLNDKEYKIIDGSERDLANTTIYIRSVITCKTPNPHETCHICAGMLSQNISRFQNVGHLGAVTSTGPVTQMILSIKHVNMSSTVIRIALEEYQKRYMNTGPNGSEYYIQPAILSLDPTITLKRDDAFGLIDLKTTDNLEKISLPRISNIESVMLSVVDKGQLHSLELPTHQKGKNAMLSRELLAYLKQVGWTIDAGNNFVFKLDQWDPNQPLFVMQNREESYVDLAQTVDTTVISNQTELKKRYAPNAPLHLLQELFSLINGKLNINILSFECIVYGLMVESGENYRMGRNKESPVLGLAKVINSNRSLGSAYAFEGQHLTISNPNSFFQGYRPNNPMDVFLMPREVVLNSRKHGT